MTVEKPENMFLKQKIFIILWLDDSFYRYENCWIFSIGKEPARVFLSSSVNVICTFSLFATFFLG